MIHKDRQPDLSGRVTKETQREKYVKFKQRLFFVKLY